MNGYNKEYWAEWLKKNRVRRSIYERERLAKNRDKINARRRELYAQKKLLTSQE